MQARKHTRGRRSAALTALVAAAWVASPAPSGAAAPLPARPAELRLSNAPVTLEHPEEWRDWAINLAAYADTAAARFSEILGVAIPGGVIRWEPASGGQGSGADGYVDVGIRNGRTLVTTRTNVPLMTQDYGVAYALGYGRWLGAYTVARVAMGAPDGDAPWWTDGAALYLTDRLFRDSRSTTPVLYGIESNFTRAAQSRRPVDLSELPPSAAARGKAYATFRLLEAVYGPEPVATAIGRLIARPSIELAAVVDALGRTRVPDPDRVLRDWLEPTVSIDIGLDDVRVRDGGKRLTAKVLRSGPIPLPISVQVRCADGSLTTETIAVGSGNSNFETALSCTPTSVAVDPFGLIPDVNRSNNRHGFGNADNVRRFFAFDQRFSVGELQLSGTVELDESQQRSETFQLRISNLTDRASGVGVLVSARWLDRPERVQRAFFVHIGPNETRIIEEALGYPNRGRGHAEVEARFWETGGVEDFTDRLVTQEPGALNAYVVVREAPEAPRRARRGIYRVPPPIAETTGTVTEAEEEAPAVAVTTTPIGSADTPAAGDAVLAVTVLSPRPEMPPIGDVSLVAGVSGSAVPERVEFWVNDRRVGTVREAPWSLSWTFPEEEQVFVVRAVAVAGDRIASDDVLLDKAAISFASTVNLVTVHATVRDGQGRLIRNLAPENFRIVEDGTAQEIVQFEFGEVPVSAALLLDQSSSMLGSGIRAERAGAERLIESLVSEVNRAMVLGFDDRVWLYSDFSHDKEALTASLQAIDPDGPTALFDTLAEAIRKVNRRSGKRALVVLSDGLDTNSVFAYEDVQEYLRQSDLLVYTIGLQLMQEGTELGDASGAVRRGVEQLRELADATGGAAYFPLGLEELEEIYGLIADELNSQYALSYYPRNPRFDGGWRQLRVEVPGRADAWVQVREGYYGVGRGPR